MKYAWKKHVVLFSIGAIFIVYVAWSQFHIYQLSKNLSVEEERVFNIARHLELWKDITINYDGYLDQEKFLDENREIELTKIDRNESEIGIKKGDKLYIMYYKTSTNKNKLRRYFSDLVL